ncbi:hypothetical protein BH747_05165 [Enterococcus villorum]|uniref:Uncharacterized protein n=1 Tax=Enterococcus villorum TaxID=112904 RepID=A0A1V8YR62_9ENTE|nr:hypothetical protein BH747_05165 [Enterococcus villorum]OQO75097.1 hypothetical protein BH744_05690 [Enterococcus villorum]
MEIPPKIVDIHYYSIDGSNIGLIFIVLTVCLTSLREKKEHNSLYLNISVVAIMHIFFFFIFYKLLLNYK